MRGLAASLLISLSFFMLFMNSFSYVTPQSEHSAPSIDVEGPLCKARVVTILRTSNLINLYTPDNNFLIQIIIFWKSQTYQNDKSLSSYSYKIVQSPTIGFM